MSAAPDDPRAPPPRTTGRVRRVLLLAAGWASVAFALAGVVLPLVPTTPFVLLAAACFVRASPQLHRRLVQHPRLGPFLERWRRDRAVPRAAKRRAYLVIVLSFSLSILFVGWLWLRLALGALGLGVIVFVARLRTVEEIDAEAGPARSPRDEVSS